MFSDFPNLHPMVVHFPIVLILLSAVLQALLIFKDWQQVRWLTLIIMGAAFASALVASTIFHGHPAGLSPQATEIYTDHETYSGYTLWISGITLLLRGIGEFYRVNRRSYEILVFASALIASVFLSLAGHRGAQLVYVEGVGPKGNLLAKEGHDHGGSNTEMNHQMPEGASPGGAHGQHPDSVSGKKAKPGADNRQNMPGMDHSPGSDSSMPGMEQHPAAANPAKKGMDMSGHDQMPGMSPPTSPQPGSGQAKMPRMANMNHPMPANKTKAKEMDKMAGMDHSQMNMAKNKKPVTDHASIGHGTTAAPGKQPSMGNMPGMGGMDHSNMPATGNQPPMGTMPGMSGMEGKTDSNGRPLIDPTEPYDNNPARKQAPRHPKEQ